MNTSTLQNVLELARWAPSGDNTQPWRFEILGEDHVLVHGFDTRDHCVYDLEGHGSQMAVGALLETLALAASLHGYRAHIDRRPETPENHLLFDVRFQPSPEREPDPLASWIERRSVQRRLLSFRSLTATQKDALERSVGAGYRIRWFEILPKRFQIAKLCFHNAKIRLITRECFEVHRQIIEWGSRFSADRIPSRAIGVDPVTERLMQWVLASWRRVRFFNTYLMGHLAPRLELDFLPGLACAAHFAIKADAPPRTVDARVSAGRAMQRFWLTATAQGLQLQPEMTPLIFANYICRHIPFTADDSARRIAERLAPAFERLIGNPETIVFMGRIGSGRAPYARSLRLRLERLML